MSQETYTDRTWTGKTAKYASMPVEWSVLNEI